jgi:hypothetical protein
MAVPVRRRKRLRHLFVNPCVSTWGRRFFACQLRAHADFQQLLTERKATGTFDFFTASKVPGALVFPR